MKSIDECSYYVSEDKTLLLIEFRPVKLTENIRYSVIDINGNDVEDIQEESIGSIKWSFVNARKL